MMRAGSLLMLLCGAAWGAEYTASTASQADVSTAVGLASDGDTVLIPDGTVTWTSGISTTKQIIIRAENYTPTKAGTGGSGATTRNVTITNNSADPLFDFTSGNSYHCGVGGIRFNEGTGDGSHVVFSGTGSKPPLLFDCYMENKSRSFPADRCIEIRSKGAVVWNLVMDGTFAVSQVGEGSMLIDIPNTTTPWESDDTFGDKDTNGNVNVYVEDSTVIDCGNFPDADNNARYVCRYSVMDGTWGETHGFTSTWGGRHLEYYNCTFTNTTTNRNMGGGYVWLRKGTAVFTDNQIDNADNPSEYGAFVLLNMGDITAPSGGYPMDGQPGGGHNGSAYIIDPVYIWNHTGTQAYTWGLRGDGGWSTYIQEDRDVFLDNGSHSGYTKYTYPHPMREVIEGTPAATRAGTVTPSGDVTIGQ